VIDVAAIAAGPVAKGTIARPGLDSEADVLSDLPQELVTVLLHVGVNVGYGGIERLA
jgi:hypothetical protein